jgi:hypothetical protein
MFGLSRHPLAALGLLGALAALAGPGTCRAQGRWIDIGADQGYQIALEHDPLSFEYFPPMAFGPYAPGNLVYCELLPWPCSNLPDQSLCGGDRLVASYHAYLETGTCPCQGLLFEPVTIQLHYDPAGVLALGGREESLRIRRFDVDQARWVDLDAQRVDTARDVISGRQGGHARQYYAVVLGESAQDPATWGRIKAQWTAP